jgi:hypothetical protein
MDRAGRKSTPPTPDEIKIIFELASSGGGQEETQRRLAGRDRTTVNRTYNVAVELELRGISNLDSSTAEAIAEAAKYKATVTRVKDLFLQWRAWQGERLVKPQPEPLLTVKHREHEKFLVSGLHGLGRSPLPRELPEYWNWSTGTPKRKPREWMLSDIALPDTSEIRCLKRHLEPEDQSPIFKGHRALGELLLRYRRLCGDLYGQLLTEVNNVAEEMDIPLLSRWTTPVACLTSGFIDSLYYIAGGLAFDYYSWDEEQYRFEPTTIHQNPLLSQLHYGGYLLAIGSKSQKGQAKAYHGKLCSTLRNQTLVQQIAEVGQRHEKLFHEWREAIEIKTLRREFLPGPCQICEVWGGLW